MEASHFKETLFIECGAKLHKRKLSGLSRPFQHFWCYGDKIKEDDMGGHVAHVGE
jgi:hypothetical protein